MPAITAASPSNTVPLMPTEEKRNEPTKVREAAAQFESLLLAQFMKSARECSAGWLSDGEEDQAGSTATEMAEEHFAQALARQGGLGLARMIVSGLEAKPKSR